MTMVTTGTKGGGRFDDLEDFFEDHCGSLSGETRDELHRIALRHAGHVLPELPLDELLAVIRAGLNRPPVIVSEPTREALSDWCDTIEVRAEDYAEMDAQDRHEAAMREADSLRDAQRMLS